MTHKITIAVVGLVGFLAFCLTSEFDIFLLLVLIPKELTMIL